MRPFTTQIAGVFTVAIALSVLYSNAADASSLPTTEAIINKAQAAINKGGTAAINAFEVRTENAIFYPLDGPSHVRIVHKATGMQCAVSDKIEVEIKIYQTDHQGEATDVSCAIQFESTTHTLFAFKQPNSSVEEELNMASLGVRSRLQDAVPTEQSPFDLFEPSNRFLSLRDFDTIKNTEARAFKRPFPSPRGFYESVWVGKNGDWYVKQRSSAPGYYNWLVGAIWHAVWRNMKPEMAASEDSRIKELVDSRQKIEEAAGTSKPRLRTH